MACVATPFCHRDCPKLAGSTFQSCWLEVSAGLRRCAHPFWHRPQLRKCSWSRTLEIKTSMGREMTGQLPPQQNFGDYQKYMLDINKCAKTAPRKVALQGPSRTSATTRSTCRTETNAPRQHQGRWLFKVPAELQRLPEVHVGQKQMRKDSTKEGSSSRSQQNFSDYQKYMQDRNKCAKTAPRKVALQGPSRTSATTRSTCRTETNAQRQHQGR